MVDFIAKYKENDGDEYASIFDLISDNAIDGKSKVLAYLKSKKDVGIALRYVREQITGESTGIELACFVDGNFAWTTDTIYHFEKYNLKLSEEFLKSVLD